MSKERFEMVVHARFRNTQGILLSGRILSGVCSVGDYIRLFSEEAKRIGSAKVIRVEENLNTSQELASILVDDASFLDIAVAGTRIERVSSDELVSFMKPFRLEIIDIMINRPRYIHIDGKVIQGKVYSNTNLIIIRDEKPVASLGKYIITKDVALRQEYYADVGEIITISSPRDLPQIQRTDWIIETPSEDSSV